MEDILIIFCWYDLFFNYKCNIFCVWIIDYGSVYLCNSVECIWIIIYKIFIDICVLGRCLDNKDIDMSWDLMIKV